MKIFVHIGSVKTGSTTLQRILKKHENNSDYLFVDRDLIIIFLLQIYSTQIFLRTYLRRLIKIRFEYFFKKAKNLNQRSIIFSDENYFTKLESFGSEERSLLLADIFKEEFGKINVIFTKREKTSLIKSIWKEQITAGKVFDNLENFKNKLDKNFELKINNIISIWKFHEHSVYIFEYKKNGSHIFEQVKLLNLEVNEYYFRTKENESILDISDYEKLKVFNLLTFPLWIIQDFLEIILGLIIDLLPNNYVLLKKLFCILRKISRITNIRKLIRMKFKTKPA